jgi:hypothetical protein
MPLDFFQQFAGLHYRPAYLLFSDLPNGTIITGISKIESMQHSSMETTIEKTGLDECLAESCNERRMFRKREALIEHQRFQSIKHRIISPAGCKVIMPAVEQQLRRLYAALGFVQKLADLLRHKAMSSF